MLRANKSKSAVAVVISTIVVCLVMGPLRYLATAAERSANNLIANAADDDGDTEQFPRRTWDPKTDFPPLVKEDEAVTIDYPIVYVRVPRPYPEEYFHINHLNQAGLHQTNAPGAELRLLHPDGKDESLVPVEPHESITDPVVSFDGEWVYFAKFHHMAAERAHMTRLRSQQGADIYKIHVPTRKIVQLTKQERTPNGRQQGQADNRVRLLFGGRVVSTIE
jgi:hypothetical protein